MAFHTGNLYFSLLICTLSPFFCTIKLMCNSLFLSTQILPRLTSGIFSAPINRLSSIIWFLIFSLLSAAHKGLYIGIWLCVNTGGGREESRAGLRLRREKRKHLSQFVTHVCGLWITTLWAIIRQQCPHYKAPTELARELRISPVNQVRL